MVETAAVQSARPPRRSLNGVLLVDKPRGLTSNAVLQRLKRAYRAEKAGHTGTLDPLAEGLLPICFGEATKFSVGLLDADKGYRATLLLGVTTETGDAEGAVLRERPVAVDLQQIEAALARFRGRIMQVPHRYSAIKRAGRALYDYARAGEAIEVSARRVIIHALDACTWESPLLTVEIRCSKGTYVRSLAEDVGEVLGCGAHLAALRRTSVGPYSVDAAVPMADLESMTESERDAVLLPVTTLVSSLGTHSLMAGETLRFRHGQRIALEGEWNADALLAVFGPVGEYATADDFLGVARPESSDGRWYLVAVRLMASREPAN